MSFSKPIQTYTATQALTEGSGTALLQEITIAQENVELLAVMIHASENISETITVSHVGVEGASTYIFVLDTATLSAAANYVFRPAGAYFKRGDIIRVACTGANDTGIVYSKVQLREVI